MTKKPPLSYRQGDVILIEVDAIPENARELKRDHLDRIVLAYGEVTGHAHALRDKGICSFSTLEDDEVEFLLVGGGGATLRHELDSGVKAEHDDITLPPNSKWLIGVQVEEKRAELRRVVD